MQYCFIHHVLITFPLCLMLFLSLCFEKKKSEREKPCALTLLKHKLTHQQKPKRVWKEFKRWLLPTGPKCLHFVGSLGNSVSSVVNTFRFVLDPQSLYFFFQYFGVSIHNKWNILSGRLHLSSFLETQLMTAPNHILVYYQWNVSWLISLPQSPWLNLEIPIFLDQSLMLPCLW